MPSNTMYLAVLRTGAAATLFAAAATMVHAEPEGGDRQPQTALPIKHVIVIIGENRTFDHVFGVYKPKHGETVSNLLSKGIVNEEGKPGPNFSIARQYTTSGQSSYFISADNKTAYDPYLPAPQLEGTPYQTSADQPPFDFAVSATLEPDLAASDLHLLNTGASGLIPPGPDTRIDNASTLPNGPFQLTGPNLPYDSYTGDPAHRFYQMWQQSDCNVKHATAGNPSGCLSDLYPFVANTANGKVEGGTSMAFTNAIKGDTPYLTKLAEEYTMSDNHHQAQMGGTMVEHFYIAFADNLYFSDGQGHAIPTPAFAVADPNPKPGTNNNYTLDGWFSNCSDPSQPGVQPILAYLASLPYKPASKCDARRYYALNNVLAGYKVDGSLDDSGQALPPSSVRSVGDALMEKGISFAYYGGGFNDALAGGIKRYCPVCNPFQYQTSIMTDARIRGEHLKDVQDLVVDIAGGKLPAVSYVKPDMFLDGHPQSSKLDLFESFTRNIVERVQANPKLFMQTAIVVTFDEGGGYYDSGYIQPLDFFGDGPRIPLIVVSPFTRGGHVVHSYTDNASVVKFIERNWGLQPLSGRSRDNLPNPVAHPRNPYTPVNSPAIGDLFDMFDFDHDKRGDDKHEGGH